MQHVEQILNIAMIVIQSWVSERGPASQSGSGHDKDEAVDKKRGIRVGRRDRPAGWFCVRCPRGSQALATEELFETQIRPVLMETCFPCHGGKKTGGGLKVGTREGLIQGGESGPAILPHQAGNSLLLRAIGHRDDSLKMPPRKKLSDASIAAFTRWVAEGSLARASTRAVAQSGCRGTPPLGIPAGQAGATADRSQRVVSSSDRPVRRGGTPERRGQARGRCGPANADPPCDF